MSLSALLERVEGATGPDRELDADLWWVLQHRDAERVFNTGALGLPKVRPATLPIPAGLGRSGVQSYAPTYTASIDAALALIGRVKPGMEFHLSTARHRKGWSVKTWVSDDKYSGRLLDAPTPALALCAALLAAMIGEEAKPSPPSTVTP